MVSAFERPRLMDVIAVPLKEQVTPANKYPETETEDEEVKMNCIGGFAGIEDSDMSSSSDDDDSSSVSSSDDDSDDDASPEGGRHGKPVLNFSTSRVRQSHAIQCPLPTRASPNDTVSMESSPNPASSVDEESDTERPESDEDESGSESDDESSDSEEEDSEDEEDDDEEEVRVTPARPVVRIVESVEKLREDEQRKSMIDVEKELQARHTDLESLIGEDDVEERDDLNDDDLIGSSVLDRSISRNMPLVGEAEQEPERHQAVKRCLSPESVDNSDDDYSSASSAKRLRRDDASTPTLVLPELTLGPSAFMSVPAPSVSPSCCCSSEASEDQRLSEELMGAVTVDWAAEERDETNPVPLLTPPASPLHVQGTSAANVCEWPSNLTIDNAIHLMPPITNCCSIAESDELEFDERNETPPVTESTPKSCLLTPLIRGLAV